MQAIYPKAQVTIGPVIEDGFYYDFAFERPFTPEDLEKFEAKMKEIAAADLKVSAARHAARRGRGSCFKSMGENYKAEIIASIPVERADLACTGRASGSTCAAARTCLPPASSRPSS